MINLNQLKKIYTSSPLWLKNLYSSIPYEVRSGSEYRKWKIFLEKNLNIDEYKILKMKETLYYAYENTKYYKTVFKKLDCSVNDINDLKDFEKLPFIDKEIVKENYNDFFAKNYPSKKAFYVETGGSTGVPTKFLQSKNVWYKELAFLNDYYSQYGYKTTDLRATFRTGDFGGLGDNVFWKFNPINNTIQFSPFHIDEKTIYYYVKRLNELKPRFFSGYPTVLLALIENMKDNDLQFNYNIEATFLMSENMNKREVDTIIDFLECSVSSMYGHSERLVFALSNNKYIDGYKVDQRYGLFELIDEDKNIITSISQSGEIVGTSFDNYAMPLIRYKTGDFSSYTSFKDSCINLVEGKKKAEYLDRKDGSKQPITPLDTSIFEDVIYYQFQQKAKGEVTVLIVPKKEFSESHELTILNSLTQECGNLIRFKLKIVDKPLLTSRGKLRKVIIDK